MQLQQRYLAVQNKFDRAYDDRLVANITVEMWTREYQEWQGNPRKSVRKVEPCVSFSSEDALRFWGAIDSRLPFPEVHPHAEPRQRGRRLRSLWRLDKFRSLGVRRRHRRLAEAGLRWRKSRERSSASSG